MRNFSRRLAIAGVLSLASLSAAEAHVTLETATAPAGGSYKAVIRVPHGCDGKATTELRVSVPEGFYSVKPMPHAGWALDTVTGDYAETYMDHGTPVASGVTEVIWSNGNLPDAWYDEFVMRGTLSSDLAPGTALAFPTVQVCEDGTENRWTGAQGEEPAPKLTVTAATDGGEHAGHAMQDMAPMPADMPEGVSRLGDLEITAPFARATLPGAPVGGGFLTLTNNGDSDDVLISASADFAGMTQIHNMKMEGDVMKMYQMADGVPVPAHQTVTLSPGGLHVMFMQLKEPLVEGTTVDVTLTFEKAGSVTIPFPVAGIAAKGAEGHDMHGGN